MFTNKILKVFENGECELLSGKSGKWATFEERKEANGGTKGE